MAKIILSTGIGRLHLVQSAVAILNKNVDLQLLIGWVPKHPDAWYVKAIAKMIGHKNLVAGLKKRNVPELENRIRTIAFAEFFTQFLFLLSKKTHLLTHEKAARIGWLFWGWLSSFKLNNADIFHVRSCAGQGNAIKIAHKRGMKVVVDHSIAYPTYFDEHLKPEYEAEDMYPELVSSNPLWQLAIKDCQSADEVLVNSYFVKQTFLNNGYPEEKIKVAYLGVRTDFVGLKTLYNISGTLKLLFTGDFSIRKGAKYLLQACQILDTRNLDYELVVVGTNQSAKSLIERYPIRNLKLVGHIPQDELKMFLSRSDIYVFPSLCEGCASSGMEALAAGLPVITTFESGLPVENEKTGLLIPAKNPETIADAIFRYINDSALRETVGKNASAMIASDYTWDAYAQQVNTIYGELLAASGK